MFTGFSACVVLAVSTGFHRVLSSPPDLSPSFVGLRKAPKSGYNEVRGEAVIAFANELLDEIAPLAAGKWCSDGAQTRVT